MKSFIERKIDVQMALDGDTFDGSNSTIQVSGLRCQATIQSASGTAGTFSSQMQIRICGMRNADMAKLSTLGVSSGNYNRNLINVYAGDDQRGMSLVFSGGIVWGNVNYNAMPDVGVDLLASAMANFQYNSIAASSYKGSVNVASMIQAIAQAGGLQFQNNGVDAVLDNHAVGGSVVDQIRDISRAAGIHFCIHNGTVYIWPAGGTIDDTVVNIGPESGLVGYPQYMIPGVEITTLFNPTVSIGRQVAVKTSTPAPSKSAPVNASVLPTGANGTYYCWGVTHELESQTPDGSWFTRMNLSAAPYNAR